MPTLLDNVIRLLDLGIGDSGRLEHIKNSLEGNKTLYSSDMDYVKNLIEKHVLNQETNLEQGKDSSANESSNVVYCSKCGNKIFGNNPCMNCKQSTNISAKPKKKRSKKKKIGIAFGVIILLFFGMIILSSGSNKSVENTSNDSSIIKTIDWQNTTPELQQKILDKTEYDWQELSYDELMRHNENYVGKTVNLRGQVIQVQKVYGEEYVALVDSKCETFFEFFCNDDPIWINYSNVRILDGDIISYWGDVKGLKNYKSVMGAPMTVPEIDVHAISISIKKGDR